MLTTFFALLAAVNNVLFGLQLFGLRLGSWLLGFLYFDILIGALVFNAKSFGRSGFRPPRSHGSNSSGGSNG